jgi:hypothetical protein
VSKIILTLRKTLLTFDRCYGVYACKDCGFAKEVSGEGSHLE